MSSERIALPTADLELERMVDALPLLAPSSRLDARVAAAVHFAERPMLHRMRWPAAAAAVMALAAGLTLGWHMRGAAGGTWVPAGTDWQTAGYSDLGAHRLPNGDVVRSAETIYLRTDRFRDPVNNAYIEVRTLEPRLQIGRPCVD